MRSKTMKESELMTTRLMLPTDANPAGNVHGGVIVKYVDEVASIVAVRHARRRVVTASIDRMNFFEPVYVGNLLILKTCLNYTGRTSMEVGVRVEAEDILTGRRTHTGSAYLTYVALDDTGKPTEVPAIVPETEEEMKRYKEAEIRRTERLRAIGKL